MRLYEHKVTFATGKVEIVFASWGEPAKIIAQARQIEEGNDYEVVSVVRDQLRYWEPE